VSDLIVDADVVDRMREDLARVRREFENADDNSDGVAEAVGHGRLGDKLRNFSHNWTNRRGDLVEQLTTLEGHLENLNVQFDGTDAGLADSVAGNP